MLVTTLTWWTIAVAGMGPEVWPSFLGIGRTPLQEHTLPLTWSPTKNIAWKTELPGQGQSSPVIWADKVFVTSISGANKDTCHVTAIALSNGKVVWDRSFPSSQKTPSSYYQSRAAPTPVVDSQRLYAFFETGELLALTHGGETCWVRSLVKEYGPFEARYGLAASLTQTSDLIFVLVEHDDRSYLLAVDKKTGRTVWKTERSSGMSFASPVVLPLRGQEMLVISSNGSVTGYDPATGKLLWSFDEVAGNTSGIAYPAGENAFLVHARPSRTNENLNEAKRSNFLMQISLEPPKVMKPEVRWRANALPSFGNPIVHQNIAYWVNNVGVVSAYDLTTGKELYTARTAESCWATPLAVGNRVYLFGKDGTTTVIKAGPQFQVLAVNKLFGDADAEPTSSERRTEKGPQSSQKPTKDATPAHEHPGKPAYYTSSQLPRTDPKGRLFADPIQYGVAAVNGSLVIRTGKIVYCLREQP